MKLYQSFHQELTLWMQAMRVYLAVLVARARHQGAPALSGASPLHDLLAAAEDCDRWIAKCRPQALLQVGPSMHVGAVDRIRDLLPRLRYHLGEDGADWVDLDMTAEIMLAILRDHWDPGRMHGLPPPTAQAMRMFVRVALSLAAADGWDLVRAAVARLHGAVDRDDEVASAPARVRARIVADGVVLGELVGCEDRVILELGWHVKSGNADSAVAIISDRMAELGR